MAISVIFCEIEGQYAAALRSRMPPDLQLVETRTLDQLFFALSASPEAVLVLELRSSHERPLFSALVRLEREFPRSIPLLVADRTMHGWESFAREVGAVHFVATPRRVNEIVEIIQLVADRRGSLSDHDAVAFEEQLMATLPWDSR